jgi:hypothetical protein
MERWHNGHILSKAFFVMYFEEVGRMVWNGGTTGMMYTEAPLGFGATQIWSKLGANSSLFEFIPGRWEQTPHTGKYTTWYFQRNIQ